MVFASSREWKTDIVSLDRSSILKRLAGLEIARWRLKTENPSAHHYGPMAEDFRQAFDLGGNGKTISMMDASGIALASIQAVAAENEALQERVDQLEGLVAQLLAETN